MTVIVTVCILALQGICSRAEERPISHDPRHFDGGSLGGTLDISDNWLVHGGDDPAYASPQLDDSKWQVIPQFKPLSSYGIHDQPIVWYRLHVQVPPSETDLSLVLQLFNGSYEAYVNGVRIGQQDRMDHGGVSRWNYVGHLMAIPPSSLNHGSLVIAIRAAIGSASKGERDWAGLYFESLGRSSVQEKFRRLYVFDSYSPSGYHFSLQAITLLILVALIFALPGQREYQALAVSLVFASGAFLIGLLNLWRVTADVAAETLLVCQFLALIEFIYLVTNRTRRSWIRFIEASLIAFMLIYAIKAFLSQQANFEISQLIETSTAAFFLAAWIPFILLLPALLFLDWRHRRNHDAGLLLIPMALLSCAQTYDRLGLLLSQLHVIRYLSPSVVIQGIEMSWDEMTDIVVNLMLLVYIIFRVVRTVRTGAYYAAEVEAAHTVQQVLLSRSAQETPGFKVETVYLPASEVGGDFFLVAPGDDGALVALVGDVAGKGMLAAMRVSVILGALRREEGRQPSQILEGLNDAMMRQGDMGMTTACCIRIEPGGRFTVANAGHIPPYIDGTEFLTDGALPLGILLGSKYGQTEGSLPAGKNFVLMSDGVVEARSEKLGLYGFERLAPLTTMPAREIAETAKAFGQEDDITVVTVSWIA